MPEELSSSKIMMMGRLQQLLLALLLLISVASCTLSGDASILQFGTESILQFGTEVENQNTMVPALFVFGDSVLDAGTNSLFPSLIQADFEPYGMKYWGKPTGRFTNGRTYADFVAKYVGLPYVEPYLQRKGNVMKGVNYASGGSGLLRSTNAANKVIPYRDQIIQFGQTKLQIEQTLKSTAEAKNLLSRSLFFINIGANDLMFYLLTTSDPQQEFIAALLVILEDSIKVLYEAGARKFLILGTGPLGCVPGLVSALRITTGCVDSFSTYSKEYNRLLEQLVLQLPQFFPDIKASVGKPFQRFNGFVNDGERYGFTAGLTACCGSGMYNAESQCGRPSDVTTNPPTNLCDDVNKHVFWDNFHPTEKAYKLAVEDFWSGNSTYIAPVNLRTLVSTSIST